MINMYQPSLGKEELKAIKEVFNSNWLGKGPKTKEFIEKLHFLRVNVLQAPCLGERRILMV